MGSPKGRGPGLRGLHRLMGRSGGRGRAAEGQGQRDISPAPALRPWDLEDWCSVHFSETQASRDPPNQRHGCPTQDVCAAQDQSREASPKMSDHPRERWGAWEMTPSHLRHRRRGMKGEPPENRAARVRATAAALPSPGPRGCKDSHLPHRKTPRSQPAPGQSRAGGRTRSNLLE